MSTEYRFNYKKAKPNRFADRMKDSPLVVVLDPDVAKVFTSTEEVNKALRAIISAIPEHHATSRWLRCGGRCAVTIADIEDNIDVLRLASLDEDDLARIKKYHSAWRFLKETCQVWNRSQPACVM
jgi:hypothetical protein